MFSVGEAIRSTVVKAVLLRERHVASEAVYHGRSMTRREIACAPQKVYPVLIARFRGCVPMSVEKERRTSRSL